MTQIDWTISAIIPLFNGSRFITQALDSVFAQELPATEVIVVDDGSTDDGPAIVARYAEKQPVSLLSKENGGQSSARNFGISHSRGTLIALLDQDDVWYPHHLQELSRPFREEARQTIGWTYSNLDEIGENNRMRARSALCAGTAEHPKLVLENCLKEDMYILPSASMILRSAFDAVGGFDEQLSGYEDDDLFVRLFVAGYRNVYINEPLSQWRVYPASSSFTPRMAKSRMAFARKLLRSFPDEPTHKRYFGRQFIAPRFQQQVVEEARAALRRGDLAMAETCLQDLEFLERQISPEPKPYLLHDPLITAIIPLYNGAGFVRAALESVLAQTLPPDEIIVVDDGSTDDGVEIVRAFVRDHPIRLITQLNGGPSSARNQGVAHAHGDLIAFLDQDDVWYPNHLERLVTLFLEKRAVALGWTYSNVDLISRSGGVVVRDYLTTLPVLHPKRDLMSCLRQDMMILPSASLISRRAFLAVGGFDEQLLAHEDDDFFLRLFQAGFDNIYFPETLSAWRKTQADRNPAGHARYARTLIDRFPDEAGQTFVRDFIVPRFLPLLVETARSALRAGDPRQVAEALQDVAFLERYSAGPPGCYTVREPLLTAIVAVHDGGEFAQAALRSVVGQTRLPDEIIVVHDGSCTGLADLIHALGSAQPIRLIAQPGAGVGCAWNCGVAHAHGDLVAFLDQDDVWYANHLERLVTTFREPRTKELGWTYSDLDLIDAAGIVEAHDYLKSQPAPHPKQDIGPNLRHGMLIRSSASLVSRRAFLAVGGFDEGLPGYEDDDFFLRLFQAGFDNIYFPETLSAWRMAPTDIPPTASTIAYCNKLIEQFPDGREGGPRFVKDCIAPRFAVALVQAIRSALRRGDIATAENGLPFKALLEGQITPDDPVYGRGQLLTAIISLSGDIRFAAEAIRSVLSQSRLPDEIILICDESIIGGTAAVASLSLDRSIRVIKKPCGTVSSAWNLGADHAYGDLIAFLGADDVWYPDHLHRLVAPFQEQRAVAVGWSYGDVDQIDDSGSVVTRNRLANGPGDHPKRDLFACLRQGADVPLSGAVLSRRAFLAVRGFDERRLGFEAEDLLVRLVHAGFANVFISDSVCALRLRQDGHQPSVVSAGDAVNYARELIGRFPDDPGSGRFYVRDAIAPRFFSRFATDMRIAIESGSREQQVAAVRNLTFIIGYLPRRRRLIMRFVLLPALQHPTLAKLVMRFRVVLFKVFRRVL